MDKDNMKLKLWKRSVSQWLRARSRAHRLWHPWFAWHPVKVIRNDWRWLEKVDRKGTQVTSMYDHEGGESTHWQWRYRARYDAERKIASLERSNERLLRNQIILNRAFKEAHTDRDALIAENQTLRNTLREMRKENLEGRRDCCWKLMTRHCT